MGFGKPIWCSTLHGRWANISLNVTFSSPENPQL
jgi:hypothetical protein